MCHRLWYLSIYRSAIASDKLVDTVSQQLVTSGEMGKIKQAIESDPALEAFIKDTGIQSNQDETAKQDTETQSNLEEAVKQENTTKAKNNESNNAATTTTKLPFHTKEEAIQVVTQKIGMSRLKELSTRLSRRHYIQRGNHTRGFE